jgi:hypothetical protein
MLFWTRTCIHDSGQKKKKKEGKRKRKPHTHTHTHTKVDGITNSNRRKFEVKLMLLFRFPSFLSDFYGEEATHLVYTNPTWTYIIHYMGT